MNTETGKALRQAVQEARANYLEAEKEYQEASSLTADTAFKNPDTAHGLRQAARKSSAALAAYSKAMKEWADYLTESSAGH